MDLISGALRKPRAPRGKIVQNHRLNLSYFSPKVEKRSSPIEGRGLFAKRAIKMGEVVVVKGGYILTRT